MKLFSYYLWNKRKGETSKIILVYAQSKEEARDKFKQKLESLKSKPTFFETSLCEVKPDEEGFITLWT